MTPSLDLDARLDRLNEDVLRGLNGRSMLLTQEWSAPELEALAATAEAFEALDCAGIAVPLFPNELNWALFFDSSTRTKSSWAGASARLGAHPVIVDGSSTQVSHGETSEETGAMLGMNAHAMGIRHDLILGEGNTFMVGIVRFAPGAFELARVDGAGCRSEGEPAPPPRRRVTRRRRRQRTARSALRGTGARRDSMRSRL